MKFDCRPVASGFADVRMTCRAILPNFPNDPMATPTRDSQVLLKARKSLATCEDIEQIKGIRTQAGVIQFGAKAASNRKLMVLAAEVRLLAERKLGKLLTALSLVGGDHKSQEFAKSKPLTLASLGISRIQSARWQREASVSQSEFHRYLRQAAKQQSPATCRGLLDLAEPRRNRVKGDPWIELAATLRALARQGKRFRCIYAAPPEETPIRKHRLHLAALPVKRITAPDAHLHLLIPADDLDEGVKLLKAWGFAYSGNLAWATAVKGFADLCRPHTLLLIGVRGTLAFRSDGLRNAVTTRRLTRDAVFKAIRQLSPGPCLDLFGAKVVRAAPRGRRRAK